QEPDRRSPQSRGGPAAGARGRLVAARDVRRGRRGHGGMVPGRQGPRHAVRVAFTPIGGAAWTGGRHYLRHLFSPPSRSGSRVECLLFAGDDVERSELAELAPMLAAPPCVDAIWSRRGASSRFRRTVIAQRDRAAESAFRAEGVDVVFQHSAWLGPRFGLPT